MRIVSDMHVAKFFGGGTSAGWPVSDFLRFVISDTIFVEYVMDVKFDDDDSIEYTVDSWFDSCSGCEKRMTRAKFKDTVDVLQKSLVGGIIPEEFNFNDDIHLTQADMDDTNVLCIGTVYITITKENTQEIYEFLHCLVKELTIIYETAEKIKRYRK
jgi:hypothetical protein